jgi:hypothetical protein
MRFFFNIQDKLRVEDEVGVQCWRARAGWG